MRDAQYHSDRLTETHHEVTRSAKAFLHVMDALGVLRDERFVAAWDEFSLTIDVEHAASRELLEDYGTALAAGPQPDTCPRGPACDVFDEEDVLRADVERLTAEFEAAEQADGADVEGTDAHAAAAELARRLHAAQMRLAAVVNHIREDHRATGGRPAPSATATV